MENPTQSKLKEAEYFFEQMKKTFERDDEFKFNFSAFLSASRSITWCMQKQYAQIEGFECWYKKKQNEMRKDQELVYLNKARVEVLKKKSVPMVATRVITLACSCFIVKNKNELSTSNINNPQIAKPSPSNLPKTIKRFFPEFEEVDILEYCKRQLDKLEKLVAECEQKFSI